MILFIDAYNLLRQLLSAAEIDHGAHKSIERELGAFAAMQGHTVFMIYDGGSNPRSDQFGSGYFIIVYSGYSQTADDVIKRRIGAFPVEKTLIISQDRELCACVAQDGYHSIDPLDFYRFVQQSTTTGTVARKLKGPLVKLASTEHAEVDLLMHEASLVPFYKEVEDVPERYSQPKKSKKEKKMHRIIKPL